MEIHNILFVSKMHEKLQQLIKDTGVEKNMRFLPEEAVTDGDIDWADTFVSFRLINNYDFSKVKWVHSLGAGVDYFLYKKQWDPNVLLTRTICSFGQRIGEYCLSYILKDLQYHDQFQDLKEERSWKPLTPKLIRDQKIVIYGTGEIGQATAKILHDLGGDVIGVSLSGQQKRYFKHVVTIDEHLSTLQNINYVINTLPLTERTERMFNETFFQQLSKAVFINVGRGASVDNQALLKAFEKEHIRFAFLDVFVQEPLPEDHPLWRHPRVMITPHISAVTTANEAIDCFVETLKRVEAGELLPNKVNISKGY